MFIFPVRKNVWAFYTDKGIKMREPHSPTFIRTKPLTVLLHSAIEFFAEQNSETAVGAH